MTSRRISTDMAHPHPARSATIADRAAHLRSRVPRPAHAGPRTSAGHAFGRWCRNRSKRTASRATRSGMAFTSTCSVRACECPPTAPSPSSVGTPITAVRLPSEAPPDRTARSGTGLHRATVRAGLGHQDCWLPHPGLRRTTGLWRQSQRRRHRLAVHGHQARRLRGYVRQPCGPAASGDQLPLIRGITPPSSDCSTRECGCVPSGIRASPAAKVNR